MTCPRCNGTTWASDGFNPEECEHIGCRCPNCKGTGVAKTVIAYKIAGSYFCPNCVDIHGDLAQADAEEVTDATDLYDVDGYVGDGYISYSTQWRVCSRCDESLDPAWQGVLW